MRIRLTNPSGAEGFTFNEVLVAMSVIMIAMLGYSLSTIGGFRGNSVNENSTVAVHLAQDKMEQLKAQKNLANENRCPAAGDQAIAPTGTAGGIFDRCWKIADSSLGTKLKQIDVTVSWRDHEDHAVTISTLIFTGGDV